MTITINKSEQYSTLIINSEYINSNDAETLLQEVSSTLSNDCESIIIDLSNVKDIETEAISALGNIHHQAYEQDKSLAFAEPTESVLKKIKQEQLHLILNICPTHIEAVDIVSMEMLERELMKEEEE